MSLLKYEFIYLLSNCSIIKKLIQPISKIREITAGHLPFGLGQSPQSFLMFGLGKNLEEKDGQRQLLYYVSLIRACNKVLYQLVYIGKKFVFLKKNLGI